MKIALYHNLPSGGAKRAVYEWTRHLAARHTIDVFTLEGADHAFCDLRPFASSYRVYPFRQRREFSSPFGRLNYLQRYRDLLSLARLHRQIAAEINSGGYDLVFANSDQVTLIPILLQYVQIPSLYYLHEPFGKSVRRRYQRPYSQVKPFQEAIDRIDPLRLLNRLALERMRAKSVARVTRLLANSEYTRQQIRRSYSIDPPVCHYGVAADIFYPMPEVPRENRVISVGAMMPRKGFDFLIESLAHIPPVQRPELVLASNFVIKDEERYLTALAARLQVCLSIFTSLNSDQLSREYNRAVLCVYSPLNEPLGLVPLEAMACGTPVVGVSEAGVKETVRDGETGVLVDRDPARFAQAITALCGEPERMERYRVQARAYVLDSWSWSKSVHDLESHFIGVIEGGSGSVP